MTILCRGNSLYLIIHEMLAKAEVGDGDALVPLVQDNVAQLEVSASNTRIKNDLVDDKSLARK